MSGEKKNLPAEVDPADESVAQRVPITISGRGVQLTSFDELWRFASAVARTDLVPKDFKNKAGDCMIAIQIGLEVGLSPMQALQGIAVINGRTTIWGDAALGLVLASPLCLGIEETTSGRYPADDYTAICTALRAGGKKPIVRTFSIEDAKRARLLEKPDTWKKYPKRMLQMRARAFALRDGFSDVLGGLSVREEVMDYSVGPLLLATNGRTPLAQAFETDKIATPAPELTQNINEIMKAAIDLDLDPKPSEEAEATQETPKEEIVDPDAPETPPEKPEQEKDPLDWTRGLDDETEGPS